MKKPFITFKHLKGDVFGGLTAGIVALPLALAFGVQSGMGAAAGLYGAIFIGIIAAIFGGTPTQISGPTAPMTVISVVLIAQLLQANSGDLSAALSAILMVFFLAGLFELALGLVGIGVYIKYIPYPVVSGFMTGIGVIILVTQLFPLLGYNPANDQELINDFIPEAEEVILDRILEDEAGEGILVLEDFRETVRRAEQVTPGEIRREARVLVQKETGGVRGSLEYSLRAVAAIDWLEFCLAIATIFIIYGFKRLTKSVPSTLIALLVITAATLIFGWEVRTINDIGAIPSGFPKFHFEIFTDFQLSVILPYLGAAVTLGALGAIDSLLTSVVADNITKTKHDSNRELIGQGIGNTVAALFGGIPGAGATIRTVVNIQTGGKTKLSGIIHGTLLLMILLVLGPFASMIPLAVLAGILVTVGIGVMDYRGLRAIRKMPRSDALVMLTVLFLTVFLDLIQAVAIGLILASLIFMKKMADVNTKKSFVRSLQRREEQSKDVEQWPDEFKFPETLSEEVYIEHLHGPMFFGYTSDFHELSRKVPPTASHVVLRMEKVPYMDQSGLYALEDVAMDLQKNGKKILMTGVQEQPLYLMRKIDLIPNLISKEHLFDDFRTCLKWINENVKDVI